VKTLMSLPMLENKEKNWRGNKGRHLGVVMGDQRRHQKSSSKEEEDSSAADFNIWLRALSGTE